MVSQRFRGAGIAAALGLGCALAVGAGCSSGGGSTSGVPNASSRTYRQTNLVSDTAGPAVVTDINLTNPWGLAFSPSGPFWVADNRSGKATLYDGSGAPQSLVVSIPSSNTRPVGAPTGQVYNGTSDFKLSNGSAALFIFATEDGTIVGWNGAGGSSAEIVADRSSIPTPGNGAVYKGLAIGSVTTTPGGTANYLYASNFRTGKVDVYDKNFSLVSLAGSFTDPSLPVGYAPFGIQNINGDIYVTYAMQDAARHDDAPGLGRGVVNVFNSSGTLKRRLITGSAVGGKTDTVNSPWGVALAPATFGRFANNTLIGNFGDGTIGAYDTVSGNTQGLLQNTSNATIVIPGLWALSFGNGGSAGSVNTLYFTAGLGDGPNYTANLEQHGLFGVIQPSP